MHVLMTADTIGGVWTYVRELVTQLSRIGVRITLVSFGQIPSREQSEWLEGLSEVSYYPTAFRLEWMQDAQGDLEQGPGLGADRGRQSRSQARGGRRAQEVLTQAAQGAHARPRAIHRPRRRGNRRG